MFEQQDIASFDRIRPKSAFLYYAGYFSQDVITALAETLRLYFKKNDVPRDISRKLFSTFIEMVQNISRYSAEALTQEDDKAEVRHGVVCIGFEAGRYFLLSANGICFSEAEQLYIRLNALKTLSLDEIKQAYKQALRLEAPSTSKGANIGLLTLARDATEPLDFTFRPKEATGQSVFYLKVVI